MFIRASRETHSGELVLKIRPNGTYIIAFVIVNKPVMRKLMIKSAHALANKRKLRNFQRDMSTFSHLYFVFLFTKAE